MTCSLRGPHDLQRALQPCLIRAPVPGCIQPLDGLEFVAKIEHGTDAGGETKNEIRMAVTPDHRDYARVMGRQVAPAGFASPTQAYAPPAAPAIQQGAFPAAAPQPAAADPRPAWAR